MSVLTPSNLETTDYGVAGWTAIQAANMQRLNEYLARFQPLWSPGATPDQAALRYNAAQSKWEAHAIATSGVWTPTIVGDSVAGSHAYATRSGTWARMGHLLLWQAMVTVSSKDSAMAGGVNCIGLPFANSQSREALCQFGLVYGVSLSGGFNQIGGIIYPTGAGISMIKSSVSGYGSASLSSAELGTSFTLQMSGVYGVSDA